MIRAKLGDKMRHLRIGIFTDVSNLYFCCRDKFKRKLNYENLLKHCSRKQNLIRGIAYGIETTDSTPFKRALSQSGWEVKFRTPKAFSDGSKKADQDVNIAMDIVRIIDMVDVIVLCSADGDFAPVLKWCKEKGRLTIVYGCGISHELKEVVDEWHEIDESFLEKLNVSPSPTDQLVVSSDGDCHVHRHASGGVHK
jgi:uncharacterized LabA/DUF88 family protein